MKLCKSLVSRTKCRSNLRGWKFVPTSTVGKHLTRNVLFSLGVGCVYASAGILFIFWPCGTQAAEGGGRRALRGEVSTVHPVDCGGLRWTRWTVDCRVDCPPRWTAVDFGGLITMLEASPPGGKASTYFSQLTVNWNNCR